MSTMEDIKVRKESSKASIPKKMTSGAAGFDLHALESKLIQPQTMVSVRTGIAKEIPKGYYGAIKGRSGNAFHRNMIIFNDAIDSERYEEIIILVLNFHQTETICIQEGEQIAQIIITKIHPAELTIENAPHSSEELFSMKHSENVEDMQELSDDE